MQDQYIYKLNEYDTFVPHLLSAEVLEIIKIMSQSVSPADAIYYKREVRVEKKIVSKFPVEKFEPRPPIHITSLDSIRSLLNKMSLKNYESTYKQIVDILNKVEETEMMSVSKCVFDIASSNRFFSSMYARLFVDLISEFESMQSIFETNFNSFLECFNTIEYVDASENYNRFCEIGKQNEKRKALSSFYVNLSDQGIVTTMQLERIFVILLNNILAFFEIGNKKTVIDEIIENVAILYKNTVISKYDEILLDNGENIQEFLKKLSQSKPNDYTGISQKAIFKIMDILGI